MEPNGIIGEMLNESSQARERDALTSWVRSAHCCRGDHGRDHADHDLDLDLDLDLGLGRPALHAHVTVANEPAQQAQRMERQPVAQQGTTAASEEGRTSRAVSFALSCKNERGFAFRLLKF